MTRFSREVAPKASSGGQAKCRFADVEGLDRNVI